MVMIHDIPLRLLGYSLIWLVSVLSAAALAGVGFVVFLRFARRYLPAGVRQYIEDIHQKKGATPTMGGIVISLVVALTLVVLYLNSFDSRMLALFVLLVGATAIGFWDDGCKVFYGRGISERRKFVGQIFAAVTALAIWLWSAPELFPHAILFGCGKSELIVGPLLYFLWALWVILSTYNCVNFTDGLDGLAGGVLAVCFAFFGLAALCVGDINLVVLFGSLLGSVGAFLWFNIYPAALFMGDVGALSMGALLGMGALMLRMELAIVFVGFVFVLEGVSVILQIVWYRLFKRRLFLLAPIHHHFEKQGVPETRITNRFVLLSIAAAFVTAGWYLFIAFINGM